MQNGVIWRLLSRQKLPLYQAFPVSRFSVLFLVFPNEYPLDLSNQLISWQIQLLFSDKWCIVRSCWQDFQSTIWTWSGVADHSTKARVLKPSLVILQNWDCNLNCAKIVKQWVTHRGSSYCIVIVLLLLVTSTSYHYHWQTVAILE